MPTFFLVDHSLKDYAGHHFPYAVNVLRSAEEAGYEPVIATKRTFRDASRLPRHWPVLRLFRHTTYSRYTLYRGSDSLGCDEEDDALRPVTGWRERLSLRYHRHKRNWRKRCFIKSCANLFAQRPLGQGDQVFFPTISEFDLLGLGEYLRENECTQQADWHLQFHFSFLEGREPEFTAQADRIRQMQRVMSKALVGLENHRLHFYCTTPQLAAQYNALELGPFHCLPYPIDEIFADERRGYATGGPLRLTCVGGIRREKGYRNLAGLLDELWDDCFSTGRTRLVVQSNKRRFRLPLPARAANRHGAGDPLAPVEYAPFPLDPCGKEYAELIGKADVGLFLYVSEKYYARFSAAMAEMLSAGAPVIVPAGCWLSEQIAEPNWQYLDRLAAKATQVGETESLVDAISFGQFEDSAICECAVPQQAADALLRYRLPADAAKGTYLRITCEQLDTSGRVVQRSSVIHGHRQNQQKPAELFPLCPDARLVRFTWQNAYRSEELTAHKISCDFFAAPAGGVHHPVAKVGMSLADLEEAPEAVREIVRHYAHYRLGAAAMGAEFYDRHTRQRTLEGLLARSSRAFDLPAAAGQRGSSYIEQAA